MKNQRVGFVNSKSLIASCVATALALSACGEDSTKPSADTVSDSVGDVLLPADTSGTTSDVTGSDTVGDNSKQQLILSVPKSEEWLIAGLEAEVHVVRTEGDVAHVYAKNRKDLSRVMGFVMARHRYFQLELTRRLGLGEISALLGDAALTQDMESRWSGSTYVADSVLDRLTPAEQELFDAFAAGINDYIAQVIAGKLPQPSEIAIAKGLLGGDLASLLKPWTRRSVAGASAAIIYNLGYERDDVGRTGEFAKLETLFSGKPLEQLRKAGALADIAYLVAPIDPVSSAAGLGLDYKGKPVSATEPGKVPAGQMPNWMTKLPKELLERHRVRDLRWQAISGHDRQNGFGSNAWAVSNAGTGGPGLLAGDGHLPLSVPSLFYQMGLDTRVFGGGKEHQKGLMIPGLPLMAVGTNGKVGWSQTQLGGDITDWYRDVLVLGADGKPMATKFSEGGKLVDKPLKVVEESFEIANVPVLGSKGRTEKWQRWVTWDGRWLSDIEGEEVDPAKYTPAAGEAVVAVGGGWVVPKDTNKDGEITAISFDFTGLDKPAMLTAVDGFGHSDDVWQLRDHTRKLIAYSQNIVAADSQGNALYTAYQAVPCRKHLPRNPDGTWKPGANPKQLIDGTLYTGFTIPTKADGSVDESQGNDPTKCVVPFDASPQSVNPGQGYVLTGNNDPGNLSTDNNLFNDAWYIGGPWANGYRAGTIDRELAKVAAGGKASSEDMMKIQANHESRLGQRWVPALAESLQAAKVASMKMGLLSPEEQRLVDLYNSITPTVRDEALQRLETWHKAGAPAESGVATFYHTPAAGETEHAIATSIFNAWMARFVALSVDDEGMGMWEPWGADARTRALVAMWEGRGPNNPKKLAAWNPATQESAFWDILGTEPIETSREVALRAFKEGLDNLAGPSGFGSADPKNWLWGLRHGVSFESILAKFFSGSAQFSALAAPFSITPDKLPLAESMPKGDPRADLGFFPRAGDGFAVDAAGGINASVYGSGPVFRMVISMGKDKTTGYNVIPGGQSALTDSANFADQAKLWLGNQAWPLRFEVEDVVAGASKREVFLPAK